MKPLKEKISITVDADILAKIREIAENDDRSLSQYINLVLKEHIKKDETKTKKNHPTGWFFLLVAPIAF